MRKCGVKSPRAAIPCKYKLVRIHKEIACTRTHAIFLAIIAIEFAGTDRLFVAYQSPSHCATEGISIYLIFLDTLSIAGDRNF